METYRDVEAAFYGMDGNPPTRRSWDIAITPFMPAEIDIVTDALRTIFVHERNGGLPLPTRQVVIGAVGQTAWQPALLSRLGRSELTPPRLPKLQDVSWVEPMYQQAQGLYATRRALPILDDMWQLDRRSVNYVLGANHLDESETAYNLQMLWRTLRDARYKKDAQKDYGPSLGKALDLADRLAFGESVILQLADSEINPKRMIDDLRPGVNRWKRAAKAAVTMRSLLFSRKVAHEMHQLSQLIDKKA